MDGPVFDLNDPGQAFELTRPLAEAARHGGGAAAARGAAPELAAMVERAAALILPPLALVRRWWVRMETLQLQASLSNQHNTACMPNLPPKIER